jgi:hypothetical protein
MLYLNFDQYGNSHEGTLSAGDSGGGLFVRQGTVWKLAGINSSVDGPFSYTNPGTPFNAAIFDRGGLYVPGSNDGQSIIDTFNNYPAAAYSTRVSSHLGWINDVLAGKVAPGGSSEREGGGVPEPTGALITVAGIVALALRRRRTTPMP